MFLIQSIIDNLRSDDERYLVDYLSFVTGMEFGSDTNDFLHLHLGVLPPPVSSSPNHPRR